MTGVAVVILMSDNGAHHSNVEASLAKMKAMANVNAYHRLFFIPHFATTLLSLEDIFFAITLWF